MAEEEGVLVGMVAGYLSDYFFCNETIASDNLLFVESPASRHACGGATVADVPQVGRGAAPGNSAWAFRPRSKWTARGSSTCGWV